MNEEGRRVTQTSPSVANPDVKLAGVQYERNPGVEYTETVKNTHAIANTSASHTYGNVLSVVEKYILDIFPPDTFKTVTATTTLGSRQLYHLPHQLIKKEMPIMVLAPRISFGQEDNRFLGHTLINDRVTNTYAEYGQGSLIPLAEDKRNGWQVHGHYNRSVMYIDIVLSFNTALEQINWLSFIHNMIPINHNFFIKSPLELYIPKDFCKLMGGLVGLPIDENPKYIPDYMEYMNTVWEYPITYKLKGSSNSDAYFMYYIADIDTVVQEPTPGQGIKDGQIRRNFDITFTVRCDFNTVGYFMLTSPRLSQNMQLNHTDDDTIIPIFTDVFDMNNFHLPVGWKVLGFPIFKLAFEENSISIDPILNESLKRCIDHHLEYGIPIERFLTIQFRENGKILDNEAFYIDWRERKIVIANPNYHRTYRLLILTSPEYVNNLIKDLYNLE